MTKSAIVTVAVPDRLDRLAATGEAVARQTTPCAHYVVQIGPGPSAARLTADTFSVRLPIDARHIQLAAGIGMQLALNEKVDVVAAIAAGDLLEPRCLEIAAAELARIGADILEVKDPAQGPTELGTLFFTKRAAFIPGIRAQMSPPLDVAFQEVLHHTAARLRLRIARLDLPLVTRSQEERQSASRSAQPTSLANEAIRLLYQQTGVLLRPVAHAAARQVETVAVITPYYKEPLEMLRRCHDSVVRQGRNVKHFMIADGYPNPEIDKWDVIHLVLPSAHGDNGNTPRGIGGMVAFARGYDAVAYLDADNWFAAGHTKSMLKAQRRNGARVVCAWRIIVLPDGTQLEQIDPVDRDKIHVDTSCFLITKEVAFLAKFWAQMPQNLGPMCDRVFLAIAFETAQLICWTEQQTVYFESNYARHYKMANKIPEKPLHDIPRELASQIDPVEFRARTGWRLAMEKKPQKSQAVDNSPPVN